MNQIELINLCANKFNTEWAAQTEIEWPNTPSTHTAIPYVRFSVVITKTENGTIGVTSKPKHKGYIVVQIFVDSNSGYSVAYGLANSVFTIFQNSQFSGIITYAGEVIEIGKDPDNSDLYVLNAQVPFDAI